MNKVSMGILAHNEEQTLPLLLEDLVLQDLMAGNTADLEVLIVVNGSGDRTAEVAGETISRLDPDRRNDFRVLEIARAGKANAWNRFVHEYSDPGADVLVCMDADIRLPEKNTISLLLQALDDNPGALAAVDEPVKSFALKKRKNIRQQLSVAASGLSASGPPKLCGQLYAARAKALKDIILPEPLLVEDGFIKAMLTTEGFSRPERHDALVRAGGAYHLFEAETRLIDIFRHEKRIIMGTVCNLILFEYLRQNVVSPGDTARLISRNNLEDQDWLRKLIAEKMKFSLRYKNMFNIVVLPLRQWRIAGPGPDLRGFMAAAARTLFNIPVSAAAWVDLGRDRLRW